MSYISAEERAIRVKWNMVWEEKLKATYFPGVELLGSYVETMAPATVAFLTKLSPHTDLLHVARTRELCTLQKDLCYAAVQKFALFNLEENWKALPQKEREEFVLEGIWRTAHIGPDLEKQRHWCPEITIGDLASHTDFGFLRLVQKLMPDDLETKLTEPILVSHPVMDKLLIHSDDSETLDFVDRVRQSRCYFMTMTAWQILLAFVRVVSTCFS